MPESPKIDNSVSFNLHIPKESKLKVNLAGLDLEEDKTVSLTGTINSLSQDQYGKSFGMKVKSISIGGRKSSMGEEFKKLKRIRSGQEKEDEED